MSTECIDEACLSAIRDLAASVDDAFIIVYHTDRDPEREAEALEAGADDCLALDFDWSFFAHARGIKARLRRLKRSREPAHPIDLDPLTHGAIVDGQRIALTPLEFRFLAELRRQRGRVVPHEHLERLLWGTPGPSSHQSLRQLACRLRCRLGPAGEAIAVITSVGYALVTTPIAVTSLSPT